MCVCVLFQDGQQCISEPGDNEVLVDRAIMSLQGFLCVCMFVQTGHGLLLFTEHGARQSPSPVEDPAPSQFVLTQLSVSMTESVFVLVYSVLRKVM